jgi:tetratricopeptide (TPR) repeat protein
VSEAPRSGNESLAPSLARRVDAVCNRFEQAWKDGRPPAIEDYLAEAPALERPALLRELIALDMAYRRLAGEQPQAEEYLARFPGVVLAAAGAAAPAPTGAALGAEPPTLAPDATGPGRASDGPARVFGDYELLEEVARGGMGVVYKARQVNLNRVVALKMILAGQLASVADVQRFRTEAEAAANLDHPHIVQIYEVGEHQGQHYFSMKYIDGGSLADQVPQLVRDPKAAAGLLATVARAVHYAHQRGILHRDLKPGNILLDGQGQPLVTDFGLAKRVAADTGQTRTGAILGTPSYMAPEQARADKGLSTAADVYSLGAVLYELLTGRPPFRAATPLDTVLEVLEREPERPRGLNATIPRDLETICLKCLDKDPRRRYDSAAALADDLERWRCGEPILARPSTAAERLLKWARRRPAAAALVGLTATVLLGGMTAVLWYAERERARADQERAQALQERALRQEAEDQRVRAVQAEQQAKASEAEAQTVLSFFQDKVLAAARPRGRKGGLGTDATIRAALDAAEPGVAQAFADHPAVEAEVRHTLGTSYAYLGEPALAIQQFERAVALRREALGPDHPKTLTSMNNLALVYKAAGQLSKALPLFEQTLAKCKQKFGPDHRLTLQSINSLATAYQAIGQLAKALPLFEQVLAKQREKFGPDDPQTLLSMNNLAMAYKTDGQFKKAVALYEQALAKFKEKLGPDHPDTLGTMNNLAQAYQAVGELKKALPLSEQVLVKQQEQLGPDHPDTLTSMNNLANAYYEAGQLDKAVPLHEQVLAKRKEKLGPDHPDTLTSMNNLARVYKADGQVDKALPLYEQVLAKRKEKLGPDHPDTLLSMNNLAKAYQAVGQFDKALALFMEALAKRKEKLGPDHRLTLRSMSSLGWAYQEAGQLEQAIPLLEQALTKTKEKLGPDDPDTLSCMGNLGASYLAAKQPDKALPLLYVFLAAQRKRLGPDHPSVASLLVSVAKELLKCGQFTDAEKVLREALTIRETKLPDDWTTFLTQSLLGASLLGQKKYSEAQPLLLAGYEGIKQREAKIPVPAKKDLTKALDQLVQLYDAWGKPDRAAHWRAELEKLPKPPEPPKAK